jgi:protein-tyrosine phosphatase
VPIAAPAADDALPRAVPLEGASNLRDLGGWKVADGRRRLRPGLVFRSASLARLTDGDVATLAALGLRNVVDLRGVEEAARAPSRLPLGATRVALPIEPTVGASLRDLLRREASTGEDVVLLLDRAYREYATTHIGQYRRMFALLLEEGGGGAPLLFHCSAGKDRTGMGAALLLTALGATRETVLADYVATDRHWRREYALPAGTPKPLADALYGTHPALLEAALDAGIAAFGSQERLIEEGLGLDARRREALQDLLLEG